MRKIIILLGLILMSCQEHHITGKYWIYSIKSTTSIKGKYYIESYYSGASSCDKLCFFTDSCYSLNSIITLK